MTYDAAGNLLALSAEVDKGMDGVVDSRTLFTHTYDANNVLLETRVGSGGTGSATRLKAYAHTPITDGLFYLLDDYRIRRNRVS